MSKPQVTITLGRSGQVVKRSATISDGSCSDLVQLTGSKRSVRERLGSNVNQSQNKRQRGDGNKWSSTDDVDGAQIGRDDLRYKLMLKKMSKQTQSAGGEQNNMDLREKLSRAVQPPMRTDPRQKMPAPKSNGLLGKMPSSRSAYDMMRMDSTKKSDPAWSLNGLRFRSPDRILGTSRGLSPPRSMGRPFDASRPTPLMRKDVLDASRPASLMTKSTLPHEAAKSVSQLPPSSGYGVMQKSSYTGGEPVTVASLLHSLGLGKYAILFQAEEVDMTALKQMRDNDLKELGIPMGPRKKILLAVLPNSSRRP